MKFQAPDTATTTPAKRAPRKKQDRETIDLLVNALVAKDDDRPRTQQREPGPSSAYGCQRTAVYRQLGVEPTNPNVKRLPSILGTAIHAVGEEALSGNPRFLLETEVPGIREVIGPAHIDCYDQGRKRIIDWKTTKLKSLRYFPKESQLGQVHIYGYLARRAGLEVETVELVAIPRDGTEDDIVSHAEEYDEAKALKALVWFEEVAEFVRNGELPPCGCPSLAFARDYSPYYGPGMCEGKVK